MANDEKLVEEKSNIDELKSSTYNDENVNISEETNIITSRIVDDTIVNDTCLVMEHNNGFWNFSIHQDGRIIGKTYEGAGNILTVDVKRDNVLCNELKKITGIEDSEKLKRILITAVRKSFVDSVFSIESKNKVEKEEKIKDTVSPRHQYGTMYNKDAGGWYLQILRIFDGKDEKYTEIEKIRSPVEIWEVDTARDEKILNILRNKCNDIIKNPEKCLEDWKKDYYLDYQSKKAEEEELQKEEKKRKTKNVKIFKSKIGIDTYFIAEFINDTFYYSIIKNNEVIGKVEETNKNIFESNIDRDELLKYYIQNATGIKKERRLNEFLYNAIHGLDREIINLKEPKLKHLIRIEIENEKFGKNKIVLITEFLNKSVKKTWFSRITKNGIPIGQSAYSQNPVWESETSRDNTLQKALESIVPGLKSKEYASILLKTINKIPEKERCKYGNNVLPENDTEEDEEDRNLYEVILEIIVNDPKIHLFHDIFSQSYVKYPIQQTITTDISGITKNMERYETTLVSSKKFSKWLSWYLRKTSKIIIGKSLIADVVHILDGMAEFDAPEADVFKRIGEFDGVMYYHLGKGVCVKITTDGCEITTDVPIFFRMENSETNINPEEINCNMEKSEAIETLYTMFKFMNLNDTKAEGEKLSDDQKLMTCFMFQAMAPGIPHIALGLGGPHGTGKTKTGEAACDIIDLGSSKGSTKIPDMESISHVIKHHRSPFIDNVTKLPQSVSNLLSQFVYGFTMEERKFHTNKDTEYDYVEGFFIITYIDQVITSSDLLDRMISFDLNTLVGKKILRNKELQADFKKNHRKILSAIFSLFPEVIKREKELNDGLTRMVDAEYWIIAAAETIGISREEIMKIYLENRDNQVEELLEDNKLIMAIKSLEKKLFPGQYVAMKAGNMLTLLTFEAITLNMDMSYGWPKSDKSMSRNIKMLKPTFEKMEVGVNVNRNHDGRYIIIWNPAHTQEPPSKEVTIDEHRVTGPYQLIFNVKADGLM